jgi:mannitol-specific phosphotransferase system IIBC component
MTAVDVLTARAMSTAQPLKVEIGPITIPDPGEVVDAITGAADQVLPGTGLPSIPSPGSVVDSLAGVVLGPVAEIAVLAVLASAGAALIVWAIVRLTRSTDTGRAATDAALQGAAQAVGAGALAAAG